MMVEVSLPKLVLEFLKGLKLMDWMMELAMQKVKVLEVLWEQDQMSLMICKEKMQLIFKQARLQSLLKLQSNH